MCCDDWDDYDFPLDTTEPNESREQTGDFENFLDDLELEDFAIIGGAIGFVEEQVEEERIHDRIIEELDPDEDGAP